MKENRDDHDAQRRKDDSATGNNWEEDLKKKKRLENLRKDEEIKEESKY